MEEINDSLGSRIFDAIQLLSTPCVTPPSPVPSIPVTNIAHGQHSISGTPIHYSGVFRSKLDFPRFDWDKASLDVVWDDPIAELKKLRETDGIVEYHEKFELIRPRVSLSEAVLVSLYLAGLRMDTQTNIRMFRPHSIRECLLVGRLYEQAHPEKPCNHGCSNSKNNNGAERILPFKKEYEFRSGKFGAPEKLKDFQDKPQGPKTTLATSSALWLPNGEDTPQSALGFDVEATGTTSSVQKIEPSGVNDMAHDTEAVSEIDSIQDIEIEPSGAEELILTKAIQDETDSDSLKDKEEIDMIESIWAKQSVETEAPIMEAAFLQNQKGENSGNTFSPVEHGAFVLFSWMKEEDELSDFVMAKRQWEPGGITKMFWKLLVCLGVHNIKFDAKMGVYFCGHRNSRRLITHNTVECKELPEFTVEQFEKPLITILSYGKLHSPRPPELQCRHVNMEGVKSSRWLLTPRAGHNTFVLERNFLVVGGFIDSQNLYDDLFDGEICVWLVTMEEGSYAKFSATVAMEEMPNARFLAAVVYFGPYKAGYEVYHLQRPPELIEFVFRAEEIFSL